MYGFVPSRATCSSGNHLPCYAVLYILVSSPTYRNAYAPSSAAYSLPRRPENMHRLRSPHRRWQYIISSWPAHILFTHRGTVQPSNANVGVLRSTLHFGEAGVPLPRTRQDAPFLLQYLVGSCGFSATHLSISSAPSAVFLTVAETWWKMPECDRPPEVYSRNRSAQSMPWVNEIAMLASERAETPMSVLKYKPQI